MERTQRTPSSERFELHQIPAASGKKRLRRTSAELPVTPEGITTEQRTAQLFSPGKQIKIEEEKRFSLRHSDCGEGSDGERKAIRVVKKSRPLCQENEKHSRSEMSKKEDFLPQALFEGFQSLVIHTQVDFQQSEANRTIDTEVPSIETSQQYSSEQEDTIPLLVPIIEFNDPSDALRRLVASIEVLPWDEEGKTPRSDDVTSLRNDSPMPIHNYYYNFSDTEEGDSLHSSDAADEEESSDLSDTGENSGRLSPKRLDFVFDERSWFLPEGLFSEGAEEQ